MLNFNRSGIFIILLLLSADLSAQMGGGQQNRSKYTIGIHADPVISWFSSDIDSVRNDGARSGFNFGLTFNYFFGPNYAFSTGINLISAGGRLVSKRNTDFELSDNHDLQLVTVNQNDAIVYKVQYLSVPIGLKLQTNQIGYITFFTDLGIDPKIAVGRKVDIPANDIENRKALSEI
ncbi:MAG: porin family protein, partial [Bacteroidia bacterium]|nr:porin family protein [Bacteroidia bacterium]